MARTCTAAAPGWRSFVYDDEQTCLEEVRYLLSLLPPNNRELPPKEITDDPADRPCTVLLDLVPAGASQAYDMRQVIGEIVDCGEFLEVHEAGPPTSSARWPDWTARWLAS